MLGLILMEIREVLRENEQHLQEHNELVENCTDCKVSNEQCSDHDKSSSPVSLYLLSLRF